MRRITSVPTTNQARFLLDIDLNIILTLDTYNKFNSMSLKDNTNFIIITIIFLIPKEQDLR
ncbi:MAG: hypothetical protein H8D45_11715 [Bacteroidetes bacterium]|nr:hypothetical protein [Bacteroidota bacterium]